MAGLIFFLPTLLQPCMARHSFCFCIVNGFFCIVNRAAEASQKWWLRSYTLVIIASRSWFMISKIHIEAYRIAFVFIANETEQEHFEPRIVCFTHSYTQNSYITAVAAAASLNSFSLWRFSSSVRMRYVAIVCSRVLNYEQAYLTLIIRLFLSSARWMCKSIYHSVPVFFFFKPLLHNSFINLVKMLWKRWSSSHVNFSLLISSFIVLCLLCCRYCTHSTKLLDFFR